MKEKSTRIMVFSTAYRPLIGGSELAIENIVKQLPDVFFDILTPKYDRNLSAHECSDNFCIYRIGLGLTIDKILFPLLGFIKAAQLLNRSPYNFMHGFEASYASGAARLIKFFSNIPFILTLQEGKELDKQNFFIRFFRRIIIRKADIVTAISRYLEDYARIYNPRAKIYLIPNGINLEQIKLIKLKLNIPEIKKTLQIDENEKIIITVSRLVRKNGIEVLIDAFVKVANKIPSKLLIIGSGELENDLKFKIKNLKLENRIIFLGEKTHDEIYKYLFISDVFARPSYSEGLGTAFLEAMACGLPIIGTPVGGIPDFLKDGETGLFSKVGNSEDLYKKIIQILSDTNLKNRLSENGRKMVFEKFKWDNIAKQYREIFLS